MPNPFFSARIPQDLLDKIEQRIAETGESKTQILIKALAAYVNHPVEIQEPPVTKGVSMEMFASLEDRVANLERWLQTPKEFVINLDNTRNQTDSGHPAADMFIGADSFDIIPDPWLNAAIATAQITTNNVDNIQTTDVIELGETVLLIAPSASTKSGQADNTDNVTRDIKPQQVELFDRPQGSIGPYSESRMANELRINRNKLRKHARQIEEGEIAADTPMKVTKEDQLYCVSYLGKTERRKLWTATLVAPNP